MDPVSATVMAMATGAAAVMKPTAITAVRDAYFAIKSMIKDRYKSVNVNLLECDPSSPARQAVLREDLEKADAASDEDLLARVDALLDAIEQYAPESAGVVGVSLEDVRAASLQIQDIISTGHGVVIRRSAVQGDLTIEGVRAGSEAESSKKNSDGRRGNGCGCRCV